MGIFRRSRGRVEPDPGLPMFADGRAAARFAALARQVFAEQGLECSYADGALQGADGQVYGLANVALLAVHHQERQWPDLVSQHVRGITAAHATPKVRDLEVVRDRIYLRLWATEDVETAHRLGHAADWSEPMAPGLVGLASIDHPEHIETITGGHDIDLLGGWSAVRRAAMGNLVRLRADDVAVLGEGDAQVQVSVGGFFNASRSFAMLSLLREDFLIESPRHGVLFVVPNRHLVAVHPIDGVGMMQATATLARLAEAEYDVPGSISSDIWLWRDGEVHQATRRGEDGAVELHVEGALERAMREVGLIEDPG